MSDERGRTFLGWGIEPVRFAPAGRGRLSAAETQALMEAVPGPSGELPREAAVLVAGAGITGLVAANMLGALGVRTVVVERSTHTTSQPKAIAMDDEFQRLLDRLGFAAALETHVSEPFGIHFIAADGRPIVEVAPFQTPNGFGNRVAVNHAVLEKMLLKGAQRFPSVSFCYGADVASISPGHWRTKVEVRRPGDAGGVVEARHVLACDGAKSTVRSLLEVPFAGKRISEPHIVLDLADFPDDANHSRFICSPDRPVNSIPAPYGGRRIEFMLREDDDREAVLADESLRRLVDTFTPYAGVPLHVLRRAIYGFSHRIVRDLRHGDVFFLGDAAHVMPPFGGQGMNTGARDAANLCWKLAAIAEGRLPDALLDTYEPERRPQIERIVRYSVGVGRFANVRSRPLARWRDRTLRAVQTVPAVRRYFSQMRYMPRPRIAGGLVLPGQGPARPGVGAPLPRLSLSDGGTDLAIDDRLDGRLALVAIDLSPDEEQALASQLRERRSEVAIIPVRLDAPASPRGTQAALRFYRSCRGRVLVVRPDLYVAGNLAPGEVAAGLGTLAGMLGRGRPADDTTERTDKEVTSVD